MTFIIHPCYTELKHDEESGSGYDEYDSASASLYYADEASGSGSGNWDDDNDEGECRTLAILSGSCTDHNSSLKKENAPYWSRLQDEQKLRRETAQCQQS